MDSPGVYLNEVVLTATYEPSEKSASCTLPVLVVYDPSGGFVTGGGWIESPAGAYTEDLSLDGKANFGFISKYKKGKSIPEGNTKFVFKAADLKFESTTYEWL